jgi:hypothetical protein
LDISKLHFIKSCNRPFSCTLAQEICNTKDGTQVTLEGEMKLSSPGYNYKIRAPPRAIPATAMTAVRNGNCSMGAVALDDLEVAEVTFAVVVEVWVAPAAEDADDVTWSQGQLPVNNVTKKMLGRK